MLDIEQYHAISGNTAREIAATAETAIREGRLKTGEALPTVRALAEGLGTSPATVNSAYRTLRQRGLVIADGRRGTRVAPRPALRVPRPPRLTPRPPARRDLAVGLADPELLPPIGPALAKIDLDKLSLEGADPDLLEIGASLMSGDGIPADWLTVVSGALDGTERVLAAHLRPGDRVVIEDPAYPPIRDILLALGLIPVPVTVDDRGMLPDAFAAALAKGVQALAVVPRAQNPLGAALDPDRVGELRASLERHPEVLIVEDDHAGGVAGAPFFSLTPPGWSRWAVIRSVSKTLHPDLRLALVAGDETTIARVEGRQALGPRWVSHILQGATAVLLRDPETKRRAERARETYGRRRAALIDELAQRGIGAHGVSGLNVWVPVREEAPVVRALLDEGWAVLAGEPFRLTTPPGIRITISTLREQEAPELAEVIAAVEDRGRSRRAY
jgi:DNA-binding transcriptional MocR family regulator